jgi:hypothetical protein
MANLVFIRVFAESDTVGILINGYIHRKNSETLNNYENLKYKFEKPTKNSIT